MARLKLVLPTFRHKEIVLAYKQDFIENNDTLHGCAGLKDAPSFESWCQSCSDNLHSNTAKLGLVPSHTYLAISTENNDLIGMIDIRHYLNDKLLQTGGHIGYSIRKSARNQGYATEMLSLALKECRRLELSQVLITCDKDNIASAKTIIKNGGLLENEVVEGDHVVQRYWITVK